MWPRTVPRVGWSCTPRDAIDRMSEPATLPRPRQVTMAAWMIIGGSLLVVLTVFDRMAGLNSLDTREAITLFLSEPPGDGLGLSVSEAIATIRVLSMVAGACAAAAAILGFHVLRRHKGARIALTVLAVPLFLTGFATGGFLSSLVAASALMLWLEPSRDWFAGRPPREKRRSERPEGRAPEERRSEPSATEAPPQVSTGPRPHQGFGTPPASSGAPAHPPAYPSPPAAAQDQQPQVHAPYAPPQHWGPPPRRPGAVTAAAVITWVTTGLVSLLLAISAIAMLASPDLMMDEALKANPSLADSDLTVDALQVTVVVVAAIGIAWSIAASAFAAVLVLRRREWARLSLLISTGAAGMLCLSATVLAASVPMLVPLVACAVTFWLLLRRDVRAWMAAP